ncbi:MAG: hypothetical protein K6U08_00655 [Firmicutes bacterium]|nr:hypothetical protein [Bacillota bacterium]
MSIMRTVTVSTPPVRMRELEALLAAAGRALAAETSKALRTMGREAAADVARVFETLRQCGGDPGNLLVSYTRVDDLDLYTGMLTEQGFSVEERAEGLFTATRGDAETLTLVDCPGGIAVLSADAGLIETSQHDFTVTAVAHVLEEAGYMVTVDRQAKGSSVKAVEGKAEDAAVTVTVNAQGTLALVDTRRERRPKCDVIHQLVRRKLSEPSRQAPRRERRSRTREVVPQVRVRSRGGGRP